MTACRSPGDNGFMDNADRNHIQTIARATAMADFSEAHEDDYAEMLAHPAEISAVSFDSALTEFREHVGLFDFDSDTFESVFMPTYVSSILTLLEGAQ